MKTLDDFYSLVIAPDSYDFCVYALSLDDKLVYIGITCQLKERMLQHIRKNRITFNRIKICPVADKGEAIMLERALVEKHKPPYNITRRRTSRHANH